MVRRVKLVDLNESPRPRILVMVPDGLRHAALSALEGRAGTVLVIDSLDEVQVSEWDAIVVSSRLGHNYNPPGRMTQYSRDVPLRLKALVLLAEFVTFTDFVADENRQVKYLIGNAYERGKMAVAARSLPDRLGELVRRDLAPAVAERGQQFGVMVSTGSGGTPDDYGGLQPFLIGPNSLVYAMSYERAPGAPVWLIPGDLSDLRPWFGLVFEDWHARDPDTFPGQPDWFDAPEWMTPDEREAEAAIGVEEQAFAAAAKEHEQRAEGLRKTMVALREASATSERLLISGQDSPLQDQVRDSLIELGFDVEDMDLVWEPKEPREDYRIRDVAAPGWMVIGDATGTTKGVKGTKLMTVERYVTKFVQENPGEPIPNFWVIANHFADRDPATRPADLIRKDELGVVEDAENLVLDTVALFHLVMAVRKDPLIKEEVRGMLRSSVGQLTASGALDWIAARMSQ